MGYAVNFAKYQSSFQKLKGERVRDSDTQKQIQRVARLYSADRE